MLTQAYRNAVAKQHEEWVSVPNLSAALKQLDPQFTAKAYGYKNLPALVQSATDLFRTRKQNGTLRAYLKRLSDQPLAFDEALRIIMPIGEALQHAHERKIVHRDLKPENILFNEQNEALLADFGIAVLLATGTTFSGNIRGTAPYMAPEQFDGTFRRTVNYTQSPER